ncbi:MAG: class I SAM-dependent methyltransferase [Saccharopolyspora rectivirgula]
MDSLTTGPVADVLARLFPEAEASDAALAAEWSASASREDSIRRVLDAEKNDMAELYHQFAEHYLSISPELGRFLYACGRATGAREVVEFGTSFGLSTLHLAAAVRDNGGGRVISTEREPSKAERARRNVEEAGLSDLVEIRVGDALETLREDVGDPVDLVLLDGAFTLYRPVLDLLEPKLRSGALVFGENTTEQVPDYLDHVGDPANGYLAVPVPISGERGNHLAVRTR